MLNVSEKLKTSYRSASVKNLVLEFDDGTVIDNDDIALEDMELEQSISDNDVLLFGGISSACFKTKIKGTLKKYKGLWFNAYIRFDEHELPLGRFCVDSDIATSDRLYRDIVAYDELHKAMNEDVSEWYSGLTFPITIKNMRNSLFDFLGIEQVETILPNDSILIQKTIDGNGLIAQKVLSAICELNACFGVIDYEGKFRYVFLMNAIESTLFPSERLYPSEDLYPQDAYAEYFNKSNYYANTLKYEEYKVNSITRVTIREDSEDVGVSVGAYGNTYVIEDNFLVYGATQTILSTIASAFLENADYQPYTPCTFSSYANPWLEVGDILHIKTNDGVIAMPILNRVIKGIYSPKDTFSARGTEKYTDSLKGGSNSEIRQLRSRTNRLSRTIDETRSEITRVEEDVNGELVKMQSSITQNAEEIELKVSKGNVSSQLSLESGQITINGNRLVINASNIKVDSSGNVTITGKLTASEGSSIGGLKTDNNSLFYGDWSAPVPPNVFVSSGTNYGNSYTICGRSGKDWVFGSKQNFGVTNSGALYSNSGNIGGWSINSNYLEGKSSNGFYMRLYPSGKSYNVSASTANIFFIVVYNGSGNPIGGISSSGWQTIYS